MKGVLKKKKFKDNIKSHIKEWMLGYLFVAPPVVGFLCFGLIPLIFSAYYSLTLYDMMNPPVFIWFKNYVDVFHDEIFFQSLKNISIALAGVPLSIALSFVFAFMLTRDIKGITIYRTIFYIPVVCSVVATTVVWRMIFNYNYGILNGILSTFRLSPVDWLGNPKIVMISMVIQGIWGGIGSGIVMYISSIKGVSEQLYEAAKLDGASSFQQIIHITIPQTSPTTFYLLVTSLMGTLQDFSRYKVMTDGGPDYHSTTPVLYVYNYVFGGLGSDNTLGYASALAWVIGILIMVITLINFKLSDKWVSYD